MATFNSILLMAEVSNNSSNALLISLLATMAFTFFSILVSSLARKNFVEPVLLGKIIGHYLKDAPTWLNVTLGTIIHFFTGYIFAEAHLWFYRILTPAWYNGIFLGLANGILGALIWYAVIRVYKNFMEVHVANYLLQLILGHIIFGLVIVMMYAPPALG